nr:zinc-binding dehydrogenase [Frondihabitans sp. VKM Ac-2883]
MSSWVALTKRVSFRPGQSVLVLGATGAAGQLAIQVARRLGAGDVVAAGRDRAKLARAGSLGATATIDLFASPDEIAADLAAKAADVDVVLDYLWGEPAQNAVMPMLLARADRSRALDWIQIGSSAGAEIALPSAALRQANLRLLGSGQGSVSTAGIVSVLPDLVAEVMRGGLTVEVDERPLADVEAVWSVAGAARVVFVP